MAKTKALISFAVTAKLICVFVFAYAKIRFSHNEAHMVSMILTVSNGCLTANLIFGRLILQRGRISRRKRDCIVQLATICHVNYEWRSRGKRCRDNEI